MLRELSTLEVYAPVDGPTGYDVVSRNLLWSFYMKGIGIGLQKFPHWSNVKISLNPYLVEMLNLFEKSPAVGHVKLHICLPEQVGIDPARFNVLFTMFEVDKIPQNWVESCKIIDLILVPSDFCYKAFVDSGVSESKLRVVGMGGGLPLYKDLQPLGLTTENGTPLLRYKYRFMNVQEVVDRKNLWGLLEAWIEATDGRDDACFIMKLSSYSEGRLEFFRDKILDLRKRLKKQGAPVYFYTKMLTEDEMCMFYQLGTHYFSMSFGEGWDLNAMAMGSLGKPVIAPGSSSYPMYLNKENSYVIDIERVEPAAQGGATQRLYYGAQWSVPSKKSAVSIIQNILGGDVSVDPNKLRDQIYTQWSWSSMADNILRYIEDVFYKKSIVYAKQDETFKRSDILLVCKTSGEQCGIAEYSDALFNGVFGGVWKDKPRIYARGYDFNLLDVIENNAIGLVHIQLEYQFYFIHRLEWLLHEIKSRGLKILITQHTVSRSAIDYNDVIAKYADLILVHCPRAKEEYAKIGSGGKVRVIPMGCKPSITCVSNPIRKGNTLGFFGFTYFHKGIDRLLRMGDQLATMIKDFHLRIYAVKPKQDHLTGYFDQCVRMAEGKRGKYNLTWNWNYLPEEQLIKEWQENVDIMVLPYSEHGGWGTSAAVRTCMRAGIPIVCTDVSFFEDLPDDVVCKSFIKDMPANIMKILQDGLLYQGYKLRIEDYVKKNSWENVSIIHKDIYEELLNNKNR